LLDATRTYVLAKLMDSGEGDLTRRRHATYYRDSRPGSVRRTRNIEMLGGNRRQPDVDGPAAG